MRTKLLAAVASFAFVATGVAYAQENPKHDQGAGGGKAEINAPAAQGAGQSRDATPRAAQMEPKNEGRAAEEPRNANNAMPKAAEGQRKGGEMEKRGAEAQPKAGERDKNAETNRNDANRTAEPGNQRGAGERTGANERDRNNERGGPVRVTGNVRISNEHASRVGEALRRDGRAERVDINVRIGERIPERVVVRPLPPEVVEIVPEYRGYNYFVGSDDQIVFVSPETHEIVGMIGYEGRAASVDETRVSAARPCPTEQ